MHQVPEAIAWLDECQMHAAIIEFPFPRLGHLGGSDVMSVTTTSHCRTIQAGAVRVPTSGPYPGTDHYWQEERRFPTEHDNPGMSVARS